MSRPSNRNNGCKTNSGASASYLLRFLQLLAQASKKALT